MNMRRRYYLFMLVPLLLFALILIFFGVGHFEICLFLTTVLFPITIATPGLKEKVLDQKYKFSVLRLFFKVQYLIDRKLKETSPWWLKSFHRLFLSFLFASFLFILSPSVNLFYFVLGCLWWEAFYRFNKKMKWVIIRDLLDDSKTHREYESAKNESAQSLGHQSRQTNND